MKNILRNSNIGFTKWCVALIAAGWMGMGNNSFATLNYFEDFTTAGVLTANGWTAFSSPGTSALTASSPGLSYAGLTSSGNGVTLANSGEDAYKSTATSNTSGDLYVSFLINASAAQATGDYFLSFYSKAVTGGGYFGRLFMKSTTGGYLLGVTKNSSTASAVVWDTTARSLNTTYLVVVKMARVGTNTSTTTDDPTFVFVNPALGAAEPSPTITGAVSGADTYAGIDGIALRQGSNTAAPRIGAIRYGTTWADVTPLAGGGGGAAPAVTGISPESGFAGTIVTITGTDFSGATAVNFNGVVATSFTVNSATSITATAPTGVRTGPISVTTAGGTGSSSGNFTVPVLSIAAPSSINEGDGSQIATVTATPAPTSDLTITLTSSNAADLTVDGGSGAGATATATISANTTDASFFLNAPADNTIDNNASVNLTATAVSGYSSGTAIVTVRNVDFNPPTIVVNKFENSTIDVIELLVVGNGAPGSTVDMRGILIKDHSSSNANDGGGKYVFSSDSLWQAVPAGTLIVLTLDSTAADANLDGFVVRVGLNNATYFVKGTGAMDLATTDLVMIKASGSAEAGSNGIIHALANGSPSAAQTAAAGYPQLVSNVGSAGVIYASNPNSTIADYNGSSVALGAAGTIPFGSANNSANATFVANLRGTKDISISVAADAVIVKEDAGVQADKITVALSAATSTDLTVVLSATPAGIVSLPASVTIPAGSSSSTVSFTPINDNTIAGNRTVTIAGSANSWNSANNNVTVVDVQFTNPSVVINEVVNSTADSIELLAIENNLDMVGMILKDFSGNMSGDAGGSYTFNDVLLWQSVKAGTLVVLTKDATATEDTDASDGLMTIKLTNTTYFTAAGGFDVSNTDMVMIKAAGSGTSGIAGAIHSFGNGPTGSLFNLANGAKLLFAAGGGGGGADNATSAIVDYNGTGVTGGTVTLGAANNANNQSYITALRASVVVPPTITSTNAFSGMVGVAFSNTITATGSAPIVFSGTNLPGGLSVATNGVISGTPTAAGTFTNAVLTATNAAGTNNQTATFTIVKGTPSITAVPLASAITVGQALSASTLTGGSASVAGAFAWTMPSTTPAVGTTSYGVTFTPTDTANYNTAATTVSVTVNSVGTTYRSWLGAASPSDASFWDYVYGATAPGALPASLRPTVTVTGGSLVLTYYVRQNAIGLTVTPKASADLAAGPAGWSTDGVSILAGALTTAENGVSVQRHAASVTVSGVKQFLRTEAVEQ